MGFQLNLKAIEQSKVTSATDMDLLPEGIYPVKVSKCEVKMSNAGNPFFAFEFTVDSMPSYPQCPFVGRRLWNNLMLTHPTPMVVEISQKTMADILVACGADVDTQIEDLERDFPLAIIDKPLWVRVYHKLDKTKQELRPEMAAYFGRGECEGVHRYDKFIVAPKEEESLCCNEQVCKKATAIRDEKIIKQEMKKRTEVAGGHYSPHPMSDMQKGKTEVALGLGLGGFEDVPF